MTKHPTLLLLYWVAGGHCGLLHSMFPVVKPTLRILLLSPNLPDPIAHEVAEASRNSKSCLLGLLYALGVTSAAIGLFVIVAGEYRNTVIGGWITLTTGVLLLLLGIIIHLWPAQRSSGLAEFTPIDDSQVAKNSISSKLAELDLLFENGLITEPEYREKREQVLDHL